MADLLLSHVADELLVLGGQVGIPELLVGELGEDVVEQVELDVLLVQRKVDGLEIEVAEISKNMCKGIDVNKKEKLRSDGRKRLT